MTVNGIGPSFIFKGRTFFLNLCQFSNSMKKAFSFLIYLFLLINCLHGQNQQDSSYLDKNLKFKDGVFLDFNAFKTNNPDYIWDQLKSNLFTNPISSTTYIEEIYLQDNSKLDINDIWGISLAGLPYINTFRETDSGLNIFSILKVRGAISLFEFNESKKVQRTFHAFNPMTGIPFRSAELETIEEAVKESMLDLKTGATLPFNKENLMTFIESDTLLLKSVKAINEEEKERLMKSLLIYCDRNPVKVPIHQ